MLGLQGEQGGDHVLAVVAHRAAAMAVDAPAKLLGLQLDALSVDLAAGAAAAGHQGLLVEAEQLAAAFGGIAHATVEVAAADAGAPVVLVQLQDIQGHRACLAGDRSNREAE